MPEGQSKTSSGDNLWSDCLVVRESWVTDSVFSGLEVVGCPPGVGLCSLCALVCLIYKCAGYGKLKFHPRMHPFGVHSPELDKKSSVSWT